MTVDDLFQDSAVPTGGPAVTGGAVARVPPAPVSFPRGLYLAVDWRFATRRF